MNRLHTNFTLVTALGSVLGVSACGDDPPAGKLAPDAGPHASSGGGSSGSGGEGSGGRGSGGAAMSGGTAGMVGGGGMAMLDAAMEGGHHEHDGGMDGGHHDHDGGMEGGPHHHPDAGGSCAQLIAACHNVDPLIRAFAMTEQERSDVLAFFESLTDDEFLTDQRFSSPWE